MEILMIIAPKGYQDVEYGEPRKIFEDHDFNITVASKGTDKAKGKLGGEANVDVDVKDVNVDKFDAVVFIGGPGAEVYLDDDYAINIAQEAFNKGKVVAAICMAPAILDKAGILKDKNAAIDESDKELLEEGTYVEKDVVVDGKIITACGPDAAKAFGEKIVELLK